MVVLKTERLLLRQPTVDDASFLLRLVNEPSWLQYIGDRKVYSLDDARNYLLKGSIKSFDENGFGFFVVSILTTGEAIGMCGLVKRDFLDHIDVGFAFFPEHTRKGYAYESSMQVIDFAKHQLGINRMAAITTQDNIASIKLLEKLGFVFEKNITVDDEELCLFSLT